MSGTSDGKPDVIVRRKEERETLERMEGFYFEYLMQTDSFEMLKVTVEPGAGSLELSHHGEESHVILSGELEVTVDRRVYGLKEGDSIWYNSSKPHIWRNVGTSDVIVYSLAFPRTYASLLLEKMKA